MQSVSPSTRRLERRLRRRRLWETVRALAGFATARMREANLVEVASSMTLTTLLSLVPLMAVSLAVFAAFPSFADARAALEDAVLTSFLPTEQSETIVRYIKEFSSHASGLGVFGLAGLSLTALLMIDKLFVTMNRIFKVRRMRPWSQRALLYWAILTLAPLVIALSITLSTPAIRLASGAAPAGVLPTWVYVFFQTVLQTFGYALLFKYVPNCRVPFLHALAGGLFVAVAGLVVREGFELYVTAGTLSSIYGAFVAVPIFLLWLYLAWLLVFSGAAIAATIPLLTSGRFSDSYRPGNDFLTAVAMLRVLTLARAQGGAAMTAAEIADEVDSYPQAVENLLVRLAAAGYAGEVPREEARAPAAWALVCDPSKKTLRDAFRTLLVDGANTLVRPKGLRAEAEGMLGGWFAELERSTALDTPLESLFASA